MSKPRTQPANLFRGVEEANLRGALPLAARMRPRTLDEFVGQEHFLGPGKLLRRMLQADRLNSLVFYGPPGSGKTALAHVIASQTKSRFVPLNAVSSGTKEVREILAEARMRAERIERDDKSIKQPALEALAHCCLALFNLNEFVYLD